MKELLLKPAWKYYNKIGGEASVFLDFSVTIHPPIKIGEDPTIETDYCFTRMPGKLSVYDQKTFKTYFDLLDFLNRDSRREILFRKFTGG